MQPSIRRKLEQLSERHEELEHLLASPEVLGDAKRLREVSREHAQLAPLAGALRAYDANARALDDAQAMLRDADMKELAEAEIPALEAERARLEEELNRELVPKDPRDEGNLFLEIRAGTGGDEAAIFAGDLLRMYLRYAERRRWNVEILSSSDGEHGGFKEVIARVEGSGAYSRLKYESGTHRVQRVPATEASGRIHTSAATVAVLPEVEDIDIEIKAEDIRIDTMRSSGAGGQHVNTTDSAVRITHLPTGIVVTSSEKSQHQNRANAMKVLRARLFEAQRDARDSARSEARREQVGSGDRSERIRTYNFPQGRVTDHRINLTLYKLDKVIEGEALDELISALITENQAAQLAAMEGVS